MQTMMPQMSPRWNMPPPAMPRFGFPVNRGGFFNRAGIPMQGNRQSLMNSSQSIQLVSELDAKRPVKKSSARKTVDYNASILRYLQARVWQRDRRDRRAVQPDALYYPEIMPPQSMVDNPTNSVTTKFVRTSTNKMRCPIFCCVWTPEGRRLITGASSGEFTLWNGLTFNFETILQAHDASVRAMVWSHNDQWLVTGDHGGFVKYWQSNMNNVKMFQAHKEAIRGISFCPTDSKFVTCSDDGTLRIVDFIRCYEEKILRGHGADVKTVDWHPQKGLIVSGSKDSQQPIKLWDPRTAQSLATIHVHKNTVMCTKWNQNGNWLLTGSRDHLLKIFDIRNLGQEFQVFRGHKKDVTSVAWHPQHETLFASGGANGSILFWDVGTDKEVGSMEQAHDGIVWTLSWHPLGHILCSGSNDHTSKFWTRNRPGDTMRDKYNLNTLPKGVDDSFDEENTASSNAPTVIPGMGLEQSLLEKLKPVEENDDEPKIPGLDFNSEDFPPIKKVPYAKPIPRSFQQQWMENKPASAINMISPQKDNVTSSSRMVPSEKRNTRGNQVPNDGNGVEFAANKTGGNHGSKTMKQFGKFRPPTSGSGPIPLMSIPEPKISEGSLGMSKSWGSPSRKPLNNKQKQKVGRNHSGNVVRPLLGPGSSMIGAKQNKKDDFSFTSDPEVGSKGNGPPSGDRDERMNSSSSARKNNQRWQANANEFRNQNFDDSWQFGDQDERYGDSDMRVPDDNQLAHLGDRDMDERSFSLSGDQDMRNMKQDVDDRARPSNQRLKFRDSSKQQDVEMRGRKRQRQDSSMGNDNNNQMSRGGGSRGRGSHPVFRASRRGRGPRNRK